MKIVPKVQDIFDHADGSRWFLSRWIDVPASWGWQKVRFWGMTTAFKDRTHYAAVWRANDGAASYPPVAPCIDGRVETFARGVSQDHADTALYSGMAARGYTAARKMEFPVALAEAVAASPGLLSTEPVYRAPRPALLALTGYARTGKDTIADYLVAEHGFARVAFADAVRELTGQLYGLPGTREWWQEHKSDGLRGPRLLVVETMDARWEWMPPAGTGTLRDLLIHVGMSLRALDPDFWLRTGLAKAEEHRRIGQSVVITDCRFPNEARAVVVAGGRLVRLNRSGCEPQGEADLAVDTIDVGLIDRIIENTGTIEDLQAQVAEVLGG